MKTLHMTAHHNTAIIPSSTLILCLLGTGSHRCGGGEHLLQRLPRQRAVKVCHVHHTQQHRSPMSGVADFAPDFWSQLEFREVALGQLRTQLPVG